MPSTSRAATPMLGRSTATESAAKWARGKGATPTFLRLAKIYRRLAPKRGVRPEVAAAFPAPVLRPVPLGVLRARGTRL